MVHEQISAEVCFFILSMQLLAVGPIAVAIWKSYRKIMKKNFISKIIKIIRKI